MTSENTSKRKRNKKEKKKVVIYKLLLLVQITNFLIKNELTAITTSRTLGKSKKILKFY